MLKRSKSVFAAILFVAISCFASTAYSAPQVNHSPQSSSAANTPQESIQDRSSETVAEYTVVLAWFTGVLALFGVVQGVLIYWQGRLARDEFNATHRPEIVVLSANHADCGLDGDGTRFGIGGMFTYFNKGVTDAHKIIVSAVIIPVSAAAEWRLQSGIHIPALPVQFAEPLSPGIPRQFLVRSEVERSRGEVAAGETSIHVYCIGTIGYEDGSGLRRTMGFCWRWERGRTWSPVYGVEAQPYEYNF